MSLDVEDSDFIFPPAGGKTLRGPLIRDACVFSAGVFDSLKRTALRGAFLFLKPLSFAMIHEKAQKKTGSIAICPKFMGNLSAFQCADGIEKTSFLLYNKETIELSRSV